MKSALAGIAAVIVATAPVIAGEGPGRALIAANTVQISNNAAQSGQHVGRAFIPPYSGTARVKWEIKSMDGTIVEADVQVEHVDGCFLTTTSAAYVKQSCDLHVVAGLPVNIAASAQDNTKTVYLQNVSLNYKVVNSKGETLLWEVENPM